MFARDADSCGFIRIPFDAVIAWGEAGGEWASVDVYEKVGVIRLVGL